MRIFAPVLSVLFACLLAAPALHAITPRFATRDRERVSTAVDDIEPGFQRLLDAVVRLDVWETTFDEGAKRTQHGVGSGVIMTREGHILTNAHVVNPYAERIMVTLNNLERVDAELVGWDHWTDLAVVKIDPDSLEKRGLSFDYAQFGDSAELVPGQTVYAVGTPNGLSRTVTRGIISNTDRYFEGSTVGRGYETGYFNTWLQTDAAINPGNSGGPLVLPDGRVIGINTRGYLGAENLGFAVPSDIARAVMDDLIHDSSIVRSYIGLRPGPMQDLENFYELESNRGMLVQSVDPGSPVAEAGLRPGDIVLEIDGQAMDGRFPEQLPAIQNFIASRAPGQTVNLKVKRGFQTIEMPVVTEPLESRIGEETALEGWGLGVQKISRSIAREENLDSTDGFVVVGVQPAFPAYEAGIRRGDVITKVNRQTLDSLKELEAIYQSYEADPQKTLIEVNRNHQVRFMVLKP
ncbi:trypsin-like peptidase domain-containing protein [Ruficoccus amylovorans]|uniref:Trypsin-like peptidase domain-containing protein n=1 Tax=Ruficoccus amylovorans TaxID=1804625 RepID=A0A842HD89_9BACT|nr:trypsin-like peptidase domain-containing protein [Ruficoccus amylovorans]